MLKYVCVSLVLVQTETSKRLRVGVESGGALGRESRGTRERAPNNTFSRAKSAWPHLTGRLGLCFSSTGAHKMALVHEEGRYTGIPG